LNGTLKHFHRPRARPKKTSAGAFLWTRTRQGSQHININTASKNASELIKHDVEKLSGNIQGGHFPKQITGNKRIK